MLNKWLFRVIVLVIITVMFFFFNRSCDNFKCFSKDLTSSAYYSGITPDQIQKLVMKNEVFLLDVRDESEYNSGHIFGAKNIPLKDLNTEAVNKLPTDKPIYIYCRTRNRSIEARKILENLGLVNVFVIEGVVEWQEKGGYLTKQ